MQMKTCTNTSSHLPVYLRFPIVSAEATIVDFVSGEVLSVTYELPGFTYNVSFVAISSIHWRLQCSSQRQLLRAVLSQRSKHSCGFNYILSTTSKENYNT